MKQVFLSLPFLFCVYGKIYDRCELAKELLEVHEAPTHQLATWVCIAQHESQFNTSAVGEMNGDASKDHGIFQISDLFWCSPPGRGWACGVTCAELEDDSIEDDFICAKRIYREHKKLSGDGFNAWVVYHTHCSGPGVKSYISGCFNATEDNEIVEKEKLITEISTSTTSSPSTTKPTSSLPAFSSGKSTFDSKLITTLKPLPKLSENHFRTEPQKPWFQWFSRFRWN